jgi:anti-sigma factor RsiW
MTHPGETCLALFAGGELGVWARWRVGRHLARCSRCREDAGEFRAARDRLRYASTEVPDDASWPRLAREMRANIRVGLAAGEYDSPAPAEVRRFGWRTVAALVPVVALILIGVWLQGPRPQPAKATWVDGTLLEATSGGIELRQGDRMLSLRHPEAGEVTFVVNVQGTLRARYVDSETGQVTIHNVYAQ